MSISPEAIQAISSRLTAAYVGSRKNVVCPLYRYIAFNIELMV